MLPCVTSVTKENKYQLMICHLMNHQNNFYQLLLTECYDRGPWGDPWEQTCVRKMPHIHRTGTWVAPCHCSPPREIPYASEQHRGMKMACCIPHRSRASYGCSCDPKAGSVCWTSSGRRDTWTRVLNWRAILTYKWSDVITHTAELPQLESQGKQKHIQLQKNKKSYYKLTENKLRYIRYTC